MWTTALPPSPYHAAREVGRCAPEARISINGQRIEDRTRDCEFAVYGAATCCITGIHLPVSEYYISTLVIFGVCIYCPRACIYPIHEEILPPSRRILEITKRCPALTGHICLYEDHTTIIGQPHRPGQSFTPPPDESGPSQHTGRSVSTHAQCHRTRYSDAYPSAPKFF